MLYWANMKQTSWAFLLVMGLALAGCSQKPADMNELTASGDKAFFSQDYAKAREQYRGVLAQKPSDKHALFFTGMAFSREQNPDSAIMYLKRADLLHPNDREINAEIYRVGKEIKGWRYMIDAIRAFIATGDPEQKYYAELAELYALDNFPLQAYYYQQKVIDGGTEDPNDYMQMIGLALQVDSVASAERYLDTAEAKFGSHYTITGNRGFVLAYHEKYDEAEALFRQALAQDSNIMAFKVGLANVLSFSDERNKLQESLALFRQVSEATGGQYRSDSMITVLERELR